jgi:hypothetical protein
MIVPVVSFSGDKINWNKIFFCSVISDNKKLLDLSGTSLSKKSKDQFSKREDIIVPVSPEVVVSAIAEIKSMLNRPCHGYITNRVGLS